MGNGLKQRAIDRQHTKSDCLRLRLIMLMLAPPGVPAAGRRPSSRHSKEDNMQLLNVWKALVDVRACSSIPFLNSFSVNLFQFVLPFYCDIPP